MYFFLVFAKELHFLFIAMYLIAILCKLFNSLYEIYYMVNYIALHTHTRKILMEKGKGSFSILSLPLFHGLLVTTSLAPALGTMTSVPSIGCLLARTQHYRSKLYHHRRVPPENMI